MLTALLAATLTCSQPYAIDGDTLKCADGTRVRLWGVNAPETGQPGAGAAQTALQFFASGGVVCEIKGTSYNRLVGQCYNRRMWDLGFFLLQEGLVTEWCRYSHNFYRTCRK